MLRKASREIKTARYAVRQRRPSIQLDEYIRRHEHKFGKIIIRQDITITQEKLCLLFNVLREALRREKNQRVEAHGHLKATNVSIKNMIKELQESFKTCRESIRNEFQKIESANTDRLLNIDPFSLPCHL